MEGGEPYLSQSQELFKYRQKKDNNPPICPTQLIGKISLKPKRTQFKVGIYLTSYRGNDSRYLEDVLSIGYTPFERCSIDLNSLLQNYILVNNEDKILNNPINRADITRVWPAFGQIGGAPEFIAIPKLQNEPIILEEIQDSELLNDYSPVTAKNCLYCLQKFTMHNATRYQSFKADSVSRPIQKVLSNYILLLQIFLNSTFFGDDKII